MNKTEESIVKRSIDLMNDIYRYIVSNENWIYYFLNPLVESESNKPIKDIINRFPSNWIDYIDIQIVEFNASTVKVIIEIDDDYETPIRLTRFINIEHFSDIIERNKKLINDKINGIKITKLKEDIEFYKSILGKKQTELEKLLTNKD
mgnify:CR=1 FL=1